MVTYAGGQKVIEFACDRDVITPNWFKVLFTNVYNQFGAPALDGLIEALQVALVVALPGAGMFLSQPYGVLVAGVLEAKHCR